MEVPRWWPLVSALLAAAHCPVLGDQGDSDLMDPGPQDSLPRQALPCHKISVSNIDFAFSLYRQLALASPRDNILFSPVSISAAVASLAFGAPVASRTQLLESLGFNLTLVPEAEIQEGFRDLLLRLPARESGLFLTTGQRRFSDLGPGAAQDHIKEYVEKQTQGRLGAWAKDLGGESTEVVVNHLLLKAQWAQPFDAGATSLRDFFVEEERAVRVPVMKQKGHHRFLHDAELQCYVLQLDHAGNATTFFVFPIRGRLAQVEKALLPETLVKWDSLLRTRELDFYFPKFSISSTSRLEMLLPRVALGEGFPGRPELNISKVVHRAVMTLEEAGSEAAAATGVQLTPRPRQEAEPPAPGPGPEFSRPFLMMTFHTETGSMLLLGKVVNPVG